MKLILSAVLFLSNIGIYGSFSTNNPTMIGKLSTKKYNVGGTLYVFTNNTILIKDFTYNGRAPDAFFFVGESGRPSSKGTVLPYPDDGKCYKYPKLSDQSIPTLIEEYDGEDIILALPCSLEIASVKWLSVWCRAFNMDFGSLIFPNDLAFDDDTNPENVADPYIEYEPTAEVEPENYVGAEPESEYEPYPEVEPETYAGAEPESEVEPEG